MRGQHYDWVIVGSGFGGSVSAHRLTQKGYKVLVIEKGRRFADEDFPKTNWDLKRWMWNPAIGLKGIFQMSFMKHMTVLHGVGVGGGSLVYANTLPTPKSAFFQSGSWSTLADWETELAPHYATAKRMLGATPNPVVTQGDHVLKEIAKDLGREEHFHPTEVAVYFGDANKKVPDPYFGGEGPDRVGCTLCGACMTGCRVGAKNTLVKNYLYLAEKNGAEVRPETEVTGVRPLDGGGYSIETLPTFEKAGAKVFTADRVILAGGVMGTMPLLLQMKEQASGLPRLSDRVGDFVRSNSESLIAVVSPKKGINFSKGVAITSILHTDEHSHMEPVRYGAGSGFFRTMLAPHSPGPTVLARIWGGIVAFMRQPVRWLRALFVSDMAKHSQVLLYMRTLEGTLRMRLGREWRTGYRRGLVTQVDDPSQAPSAFMEEATDLAERFADKTEGVTTTLMTETLLGVPSTAHILGGACMGDSAETGVINADHEVFNYPDLYVIDGSAISANPGVNPSLTITTLAERAMTLIEPKHATSTANPSKKGFDSSTEGLRAG
ncbi:MAG: GMC family oxidoreductase [Deltaproteobacteria bacterium]|nr:GMC family oxidoreductase [Deltaproteobacteria bacterium]MBW2718073.1 GMC family oxidoreductase [Deltaproteobacteria bacterium]